MRYVPKRGDVVWLDFAPQAGHEHSGRRPALVLSPESYNSKTSLMLCCPLTRQRKGYPFEVGIDVRGEPGVVLADQVRSLDWRVRRAEKIAGVDEEVLVDVLAKIQTLLV